VNPDASPTARALLALELVQGSPGISADRLAEKLGVSGRAARRYVGILREAGIPIESVRGPYGGYRVGRGLRLPPLMFSAAEALGLVMAVLDGHHDVSDPADSVGSALSKIVRALPEAVAAQAEAVRRTTAPAPDRAAARPDPTAASSKLASAVNSTVASVLVVCGWWIAATTRSDGNSVVIAGVAIEVELATPLLSGLAASSGLGSAPSTSRTSHAQLWLDADWNVIEVTAAAPGEYQHSMRVWFCPETAPRVARDQTLPAESTTPVSCPVPSPSERVTSATSMVPPRELTVATALLPAAADPVV